MEYLTTKQLDYRVFEQLVEDEKHVKSDCGITGRLMGVTDKDNFVLEVDGRSIPVKKIRLI